MTATPPNGRACPKCGSSDTRALSNLEANRFYGGDRFVFVLPRKCRSCRAEFEPRTSRGGAVVMLVAATAVAVFGLACVAVGPVMAWFAYTADGGTMYDRVKMLVFAPFPMAIGLIVIRGARRTAAKYAPLARRGSSPPPAAADE